VSQIYDDTESFPDRERFGLTSQIRRAAVSIPCNIAEGQGRRTKREFHQFLGNARGSVMEVETQVLIALDRRFLDQMRANKLLEMLSEIGRILNGLMDSLGEKSTGAGAS
jgi:four helix bundle protein